MATPAVSPHATLTPGTVLGERFEVEGVIGEGAMGIVYRAQDRAAGRPAAVKVLHKHLAQSREYLSRFKREAQAASRFRHDSAVRVLGTGETEDRLPYIAMDLVEGRSLREIILADAPIPANETSSSTHAMTTKMSLNPVMSRKCSSSTAGARRSCPTCARNASAASSLRTPAPTADAKSSSLYIFPMPLAGSGGRTTGNGTMTLILRYLADGVGFEPTKDLRPCRISSPVHSTTLPPIPHVPARNFSREAPMGLAPP